QTADASVEKEIISCSNLNIQSLDNYIQPTARGKLAGNTKNRMKISWLQSKPTIRHEKAQNPESLDIQRKTPLRVVPQRSQSGADDRI
ncbi:MAG: hypothetical protein J6C52_10380, partial [Clostridia bacterium]|nr:hypothetical protein [Clostridia bacterium]